MQVRATNNAGLPVLELEGEIDLHCSPDLRAALQEHLKTKTPALALDFSGVPYIDSSGLATIVEYIRSAQPFGGRLVLAGLNERVKTIFDLVRLGEILPITGSISEAHTVLASSPKS